MSVVRSVVVAWTLAAISFGFQWAPTTKDGDIIYACDGENVTFPWSFTVSPGEEVTSMELLFDSSSRGTHELLAMFSNGELSPLPAFSDRLHKTSNHGLIITEVTAEDTGDYIMEVKLQGAFGLQNRTIKLQVKSCQNISDHPLLVPQNSTPAPDNASQQWQPLLDKMDTMITLMEAEWRVLRHDKQQLQQQVTNLTQQVAVLRTVEVQLSQELSVLKATQKHNVTPMLYDSNRTVIGFNAQGENAQNLRAPIHIKFNKILYNAGQGYDNATGDFTAPLAGTYFFIFQTTSYGNHRASSFMYANGQEVCRVYIYIQNDQGSCHAVVHLMKGDKVWVTPREKELMYYNDHTTSFAGFLIGADS